MTGFRSQEESRAVVNPRITLAQHVAEGTLIPHAELVYSQGYNLTTLYITYVPREGGMAVCYVSLADKKRIDTECFNADCGRERDIMEKIIGEQGKDVFDGPYARTFNPKITFVPTLEQYAQIMTLSTLFNEARIKEYAKWEAVSAANTEEQDSGYYICDECGCRRRGVASLDMFGRSHCGC